MVKLTAPELVEQHRQMQAQVELDRALVRQSKKQYVVAQRNVTAATEQVAQAQAEVKSYAAIVKRWDSEVKRLTGLVAERVVDQAAVQQAWARGLALATTAAQALFREWSPVLRVEHQVGVASQRKKNFSGFLER